MKKRLQPSPVRFIMLAAILVFTATLAPAMDGSDGSRTNATETYTFQIQLTDFVLPIDCNIKFNLFSNGGDLMAVLNEKMKAGQNNFTLSYNRTNTDYYGVGEIVFEGLGAFPIITGKYKNEVFKVSQSDLKNYRLTSNENELKALNEFQQLYRGYEQFLSQHVQLLSSLADEKQLSNFVNQYNLYQKDWQTFFAQAKIKYPETYVSNVLSKFIPHDAANKNLAEVRDTYFKNWDYSDANMLNNPVLKRQLDIYTFIASSPSIGKLNKVVDGLFAFKANSETHKLVADNLEQYIIVHFLQQNSVGQLDTTIEYIYQRWLSNDMESCGEENASNSDEDYKKAFYQRLGNITKVAEGKPMPAMSGFNTKGEKIELKNIQAQRSLPRTGVEFSLVFIWSSTCSHCEQLAPQMEAFAKANKNVNVLAYSIDKKKTKKDWQKIANQRTPLSNWTDIAEPDDMKSVGLSNICYMGTPAVFLINKQGTIISKSLQIETLQEQIKTASLELAQQTKKLTAK